MNLLILMLVPTGVISGRRVVDREQWIRTRIDYYPSVTSTPTTKCARHPFVVNKMYLPDRMLSNVILGRNIFNLFGHLVYEVQNQYAQVLVFLHSYRGCF